MAGKSGDIRIQFGEPGVGLAYRVRVREDKHRGGYEALLLTDDGDILVMPNGRTPSHALAQLVEQLSSGDSYDRKIAKEITRRTGAKVPKAKAESHATKRAIPCVSKWDMTAGGTGAAEGKHGYTFTTPEGTYRIWPYTTKHGRHAGYMLKFSADTGSRPRGSGGGLWHDLGSHRSPQGAVTEAAKHYARGFE